MPYILAFMPHRHPHLYQTQEYWMVWCHIVAQTGTPTLEWMWRQYIVTERSRAAIRDELLRRQQMEA